MPRFLRAPKPRRRGRAATSLAGGPIPRQQAKQPEPSTAELAIDARD